MSTTIEDRAAEARHGGRYLTTQLAARNGEDAATLRKLQDAGDPAAVSRYWAFALSPSGGTGSGRDTTARAARDDARLGGVEWEHSAYWQAPRLPEAAIEWPIYVAAQEPDFDTASRTVRDILDNDGHDEDCVLRCLRNDCNSDHGCAVCAEPDTEPEITESNCVYCGATLAPGEDRVCGEQDGDPPGTWHCTFGYGEDRGVTESEHRLLDGNR